MKSKTSQNIPQNIPHESIMNRLITVCACIVNKIL